MRYARWTVTMWGEFAACTQYVIARPYAVAFSCAFVRFGTAFQEIATSAYGLLAMTW